MIWLLFLLGAASGDDLVDGVACVVNEEVVTLSEIYETYPDELRQGVKERCGSSLRARTECVQGVERQVAEWFIMSLLVRQKLQENDMDVTAAQVEATIDTIMAENGIQSRAQLKIALADQGLDFNNYREQLRDDLRLMNFRQAFLGPKVNVSDAELRDRYQRAVRDVPTEPTLELSYKAYPLQDTADPEQVQAITAALSDQVARIGQGETTLEDLGPVLDSVPESATSSYLPSQLFDSFKPVTDLEPGQVGGPYRLGASLFVVRLDARRGGETVAFEQVRDKLHEQIFAEKMEAEVEVWYEKAKRNASIRCTMGGE